MTRIYILTRLQRSRQALCLKEKSLSHHHVDPFTLPAALELPRLIYKIGKSQETQRNPSSYLAEYHLYAAVQRRGSPFLHQIDPEFEVAPPALYQISIGLDTDMPNTYPRRYT